MARLLNPPSEVGPMTDLADRSGAAAVPWILGGKGLARFLGVTDETVRAWVAAGDLPGPAYRLGGRLYWNVQEVIDHLESRRVVGRKEVPDGAPA